MTFETISDERSFAALAGSWDSLVRGMPRPSPFMLHGWLEQWWRHFGRGRELAIVVARRDGQLVGALPLFIRACLGLRVATFVGDGESALGDLLLADDADATVAQRLVENVTGSSIDAVDLFGLPRASRLVAAVGPSRIRLVERVEAPVLDVGRDWEVFYSTKLHASRRAATRRKLRRLAALGRVTIEHARTPDELDAAMVDAFRLHNLRWGGHPDRSTLGSEVGQVFHRAAVARLAQADVARMTVLKLDHRAIAFELWFALGGSAYLYRRSYDPAFAGYGPGIALMFEAVKAAMNEGLTRVELLGGAESYKLQLADRFEPMYQAVGLGRGLRGRGFVAGRIAALETFKRLRRSERLRWLYYQGLAPARRAVLSLRAPHP